MTTEAEQRIIEAAIDFYQASGGVPGLTAAKKLDKAVEEYLSERKFEPTGDSIEKAKEA